MEWLLLIAWLSIINGGLGGQYILNWMGNQPRFIGDKQIGISPGVMTWWREISKFAWAFVAVTVEIARGRELKYYWPGYLSMMTIVICGFTGVIENIGFFYLPRYYSPHIYAPYVNIYLAFLPFLGKLMFNASIRKEHWLGIGLVVLGLGFPHFPRYFGAIPDPNAVLDFSALTWILIINACLCSQQLLNNKTVQTVKPGVGPNALVLWREIWKLVFISGALILFPLISSALDINLPSKVEAKEFEVRVLQKLDTPHKSFLLTKYTKTGNDYVINSGLSSTEKETVKETIAKTEYSRFFALFEGSIMPENWLPILFVIAAGLTGYIYSFGFFKLSKFPAHFWVPYTNVYLALLPFIMFLFGKDVTWWQVGGAVITTGGLMVGVSDYSKNKVEEIEKKYKE